MLDILHKLTLKTKEMVLIFCLWTFVVLTVDCNDLVWRFANRLIKQTLKLRGHGNEFHAIATKNKICCNRMKFVSVSPKIKACKHRATLRSQYWFAGKIYFSDTL